MASAGRTGTDKPSCPEVGQSGRETLIKAASAGIPYCAPRARVDSVCLAPGPLSGSDVRQRFQKNSANSFGGGVRVDPAKIGLELRKLGDR